MSRPPRPKSIARIALALSLAAAAGVWLCATTATVHPLAYVSGGHTANTGSREDAVATSDADTTYLVMSTTDDSTYFTVPAFSITAVAGSIDVLVSEECKLASGAMRHFPGLKVGGTDYSPTAYAMTSSYVVNTTTWGTNPHSSAEWLEEDVEQTGGTHQISQVIANADQMAGGDEVRCTEIAISVSYTTPTGYRNLITLGVGE